MDFQRTAALWAQYGPSLWLGMLTTVELAAVALAGSLALGIAVAFARLSSFAPLRWLAVAYADFVRTVPLLVHAFFWYFGATELLPAAVQQWLYNQDVSFIAGAVTLITYSAAFVSEDIRSGIRAIPHGQVEAARALGFGSTRTFALVVLPQAIRAVIPPLIGQAMTITKNTSVTLMIGVAELVTATRRVQDATAQLVLPYAFATLFFLVFCSLLTLLAMHYERRTQGARHA